MASAVKADDPVAVYIGARSLLERLKAQPNAQYFPEELLKIHDVLECVEKNADRIAHMMKDQRHKRAGAKWDDVKALMSEQDRLHAEIGELFTQLSKRKITPPSKTSSVP